MLRLQSFLLITVNALDRRLMRRASATSCGRVPSTRNRRKGLAQAGSLGAAGAASSTALLASSLTIGFAAATCAGSLVLSSSEVASGASSLGVLAISFT